VDPKEKQEIDDEKERVEDEGRYYRAVKFSY
jgi:hypothetical protein